MIAVDTNVVLRYLLDDDNTQSHKAACLIKGKTPILVTDVVLIETIWTLGGKKYQLTKEQLITVIRTLIQEPNIRFEDGQAVWEALDAYKKSKPVKGKSADFADCLIISKARRTITATGIAFGGSYTFDKAAQSLKDAMIP